MHRRYFLICAATRPSVTDVAHVFLVVHREPLPGEWQKKLDSFQRLLILRCLRADCLVQGLQDFVSDQLGQRFIEPQVESLSSPCAELLISMFHIYVSTSDF